MDYEKKYNEALERAKKVKHDVENVGCVMSPDMLEVIFPELAESEDERIRKEIINFLRSPFVNENITDEKVAPWIAYLEKQKEQKPQGVYVDCTEHPDWYGMPPKEQKPAEWSEEDEEILDGLIRLYSNTYSGEKWPWKLGGYITYGDVVKFLKSLRPQPHTVPIKDTIKFGNLEYERGVKDGIQSEKSHQWKPSEEQIYSLGTVVKGYDECNVGSVGYNLKGLYEQLKRIKEDKQ